MMKSARLTRRVALVAGGAAIIGMGTLTAGCSSTKEAPSTETTSPATSSSAPVSPTDKAITQKPIPSIEDRGGMDALPCGPGKSKYNGVCQ